MAYKLGGDIRAAAAAARRGAEATASMAARAGRSSYLSQEQTEGVPDPGAFAVAAAVQAVATVLTA